MKREHFQACFDENTNNLLLFIHPFNIINDFLLFSLLNKTVSSIYIHIFINDSNKWQFTT